MGIRKFKKYPKEQMVINLIKKLNNENKNFTCISNILNNKNLLKRNKKWNKRIISNLLKKNTKKIFDMNKIKNELNEM